MTLSDSAKRAVDRLSQALSDLDAQRTADEVQEKRARMERYERDIQELYRKALQGASTAQHVWTSIGYLEDRQKRMREWMRDFEDAFPSSQRGEAEWKAAFLRERASDPSVLPYIVHGEAGRATACTSFPFLSEKEFCACPLASLSSDDAGAFSCEGTLVRCEAGEAVPYLTSFTDPSAEWGMYCPSERELVGEEVFLHARKQ